MISLILPVYNVEKYLQECLDSILNQSYGDYELIIINDGSTDGSIKIIEDYRDKFKNIKIITQENKGLSETRNIGLKYAMGEYILFVDSDDFLRKDMLEKLINEALETNSDIVISNYYLYYSNINIIKYLKDMPKEQSYSNNEVINLMLMNKIQGHVWNKLFKYTLLKEINFEFETDRFMEDIFPIFKAISRANKITYIDEALYFYRQREGSIINKKNKKLTEDYYHAITSIIKYIEDNEINVKEDNLRVFKAIVFSYFIYHYTNEDIKNNYKSFKKSNYSNLNINFKEFVFLKDVKFQDKLRIFLWKLGLFNFVKKVKRKL
ncbi:glycosyltransferase [uncultured Clostridium sp.]|uniref:glycosyltransferase family 2 protein n=1 Tax=uncultured Clostridium sp. TaxID=59620 RepID=UPI002590BE83|nr:glycosyltransferase [uncultured Clostridium sp.]